MKKILNRIKDNAINNAGAFKGRPFVFCTVISVSFLILCFLSTSFRLRFLLTLLSFISAIFFGTSKKRPLKFGIYTNYIYVLACIMCFIFGIESIFFCDINPRTCEKYIKDDAFITAYAVPDTSNKVKITNIDGDEVSFFCTLNGAYTPKDYEIFTCRGSISRTDTRSPLRNTYYIGNNILLTVNTDYVHLTAERADTVFARFHKINRTVRSCIYEYCEDNPGFISGIFLGNKEDIPTSIMSDFSHLGISHIIAVSGMHVIAALAVLSFFFKKFIPSKSLRSFLLIPAAIFYTLVTGCIYSAIRAAIMFVLLNAATVLLKRSDSLTSLFIALYLICLFQPYAVLDISLQLSVASTAGIIIFGIPTNNKIHKFIRLKNKSIPKSILYVSDSVIISLSAIFPIIPLTAYYFGKTSALSPLMTLLISPFVLVILYFTPFIFFLSKIPALASLAGQVCDSAAEISINIADFASRHINFEISLEYGFSRYVIAGSLICSFLLLIAGIRKKRVFASACGIFAAVYLICMSVYHISARNNEELIYVCKADDVICHIEGNRAVAIDVTNGSLSSYNRLFDELNKRGITKLDTLIITRCSENHSRLISNIVSNYGINRLIIPKGDLYSEHVGVSAEKADVPYSYYNYKDGLSVTEHSIKVSPAYYLGLPRGCTVKIKDMMYSSGRTFDIPTDEHFSVFMYGTFSDITEISLVPVENTDLALVPYKIKEKLFFPKEYDSYQSRVNVKLFNNTAIIDLKKFDE